MRTLGSSDLLLDVHALGDCAGSNGRFARLRRAVWGYILSVKIMNWLRGCMGPFSMYVQSVPAAQLLAFLMALRCMEAQLDFFTDCKS